MNQKILTTLISLNIIMGLTIPHAFAKEIEVKENAKTSSSSSQKYEADDIKEHWAEQSLQNLLNADVLSGYPSSNGDITVQPDKNITRAEFTTLLVKTLQLNATGVGTPFKDVKSTDWFYEPVRVANSLNIVGGTTSTTFEPNRLITRAEMATMIERGFQSTIQFQGTTKSFPDVNGHWAEQSIQDVSKVGIIGGYPDGKFQPNKNATRAEAIVMLERALNTETADIPTDDQALIDVAKHTVDMYNLFDINKYDAFSKEQESYLTGELKQEYGIIFVFMAFINSSSEDKFKVTIKQEPTFQVIKENTRYAQIKISGGIANTQTIQKDGTIRSEDEPIDGIIKLKKMNDGTWKAYQLIDLNQKAE